MSKTKLGVVNRLKYGTGGNLRVRLIAGTIAFAIYVVGTIIWLVCGLYMKLRYMEQLIIRSREDA